MKVQAAPAVQAIALAGPTATGKSTLALHLVRALRGRCAVEIISVDSAQVYRGMDIGTAKPSAAERAEVPHHLIDLLEPTGAYSAALFAADARRLIGEITARGALPLLVGGTMLYFKALRDGLDTLPGADPAVRAELDARAAALGWPALHAELARVDPVTAARLQPRDAQRIQRALEVFQLSGRPLSAHHGGAAGTGERTGKRTGAHTGHAGITLIALEPRSRAWLHQRIEARFDTMLAAGFMAEVQALRDRGDLHPGLPALRCVGYRQAWEALDAGTAPAALRERAVAATRQLAKRQLTWLRSMHDRKSVECDGPNVAQQMQQVVTSVLATV